MGPVPHPGNMTNAFNFRNRPFERNPTTWVPSAPMRNGKDTYPQKIRKGMNKVTLSKKKFKNQSKNWILPFWLFVNFFDNFFFRVTL